MEGRELAPSSEMTAEPWKGLRAVHASFSQP